VRTSAKPLLGSSGKLPRTNGHSGRALHHYSV